MCVLRHGDNQEGIMPVAGLSDASPSQGTINLIIVHNGNVCQIDVNSEQSVEKVITLALEHFAFVTGDKTNYKLISTFSRCVLRSDLSLLQNDLKSNDELLLVARRVQPTKEEASDESLHGPTAQEIIAATRNTVPRNAKLPPTPSEYSPDFHSDIRKIFVSLAEVSANLLTTSPNADSIITMICDNLALVVDQPLKEQLVGMGFVEKDVIRALRINRMNKADALNWLLKESCNETTGATGSMPTAGQSSAQSSHPQKKVAPVQQLTQTVSEYVAWCLETFRLKKKTDFVPNSKFMASLKAMGFEDETLVKEALLVSENNASYACAWLLGEHVPGQHDKDDKDSRLDPNSPIYTAIMASPEIQLSIHNPRMLLAFLAMIENADNIKKWLNDVDGSSVIAQIFRTYHSEKRVLRYDTSAFVSTSKAFK